MKKTINWVITLTLVMLCTIISCTQKSPRALDTSQVEQIDSLIESKVNPTFTNAGQYETYVSSKFDVSSIPVIYMGSGEAYDMCVEVTLKKYGKINDKLFSYEWSKNYKNIYKYFDGKSHIEKDTSQIKSKTDTIASVNLTKE